MSKETKGSEETIDYSLNDLITEKYKSKISHKEASQDAVLFANQQLKFYLNSAEKAKQQNNLEIYYMDLGYASEVKSAIDLATKGNWDEMKLVLIKEGLARMGSIYDQTDEAIALCSLAASLPTSSS